MAWIRPFFLTLQLMGLSVLVAATIGITFAFLLSLIPRHRFGGRVIVQYCRLSLIGCIATPMILHAAAWEATAGKFGWLTFSQTAARTYTGFGGQYSGLVACVWIHGLIGAAIVALATRFGTSRIDPGLIDQSRLDGGLAWTWWRIRLPIATPWVISSLLAAAILAATEMTVVDLYGVRTLADEFYLFHAAQPSIVSILMVLVLPCVLSIAAINLIVFTRQRTFDASLLDRNPDADAATEISAIVVWSAATVAAIMATLMFAFPMAGLIVKTGQQITVSQSPEQHASVQWSLEHSLNLLVAAPREFSREYVWTAVLALITSLVCVPVAWTIASLTRSRLTFRQSVDLVALVLFLIPGPIVGLVVVRLFTLPIPGFHLLYHQSVIPTVVALMARTLPLSYWILRAGYAGIDSSILDLSRMDLGWAGRIWRVDRPLLAKPLIIATVAAAVMASGDVPATLPVLPPGVVTVGTRLFALLHSGARNQEAALAFWYVGSVLAATIVLSLRWKRSLR